MGNPPRWYCAEGNLLVTRKRDSACWFSQATTSTCSLITTSTVCLVEETRNRNGSQPNSGARRIHHMFDMVSIPQVPLSRNLHKLSSQRHIHMWQASIGSELRKKHSRRTKSIVCVSRLVGLRYVYPTKAPGPRTIELTSYK